MGWGGRTFWGCTVAVLFARFVCLCFVRFGEYFEIFWQGFSEIVLQIPLEITNFAECTLREEVERLGLSCLATFTTVRGQESFKACRCARRAHLLARPMHASG